MRAYYVRRQGTQTTSYEEYGTSTSSGDVGAGTVNGYRGYSFNSSKGQFTLLNYGPVYPYTEGGVICENAGSVYPITSIYKYTYPTGGGDTYTRETIASRAVTNTTYTILDYRFIGDTSVYDTSSATNGTLYSGDGYYYRILGPSYDDYAPVPGLLGDQPPGTIVTLNESGTPRDWVVAAHDYTAAGQTYLLRRLAAATGNWHSSVVYNYGTSRVDTWLNDTFLTYLDEVVQAAIALTNVTGGTYSAPSTVQRRVFLPSAQELGFSGTYNADAAGGALLPVLDAYASGTYWQRMLVPENGTATTPLAWWTRSLTSTRVAYAAAVGTGSTSTPTSSSYGIRPALVLPSYMGVDEYGAVTAAAPRLYSANVDGVWRETDAYQNVGGIWKPSTDQKANIEGIWR